MSNADCVAAGTNRLVPEVTDETGKRRRHDDFLDLLGFMSEELCRNAFARVRDSLHEERGGIDASGEPASIRLAIYRSARDIRAHADEIARGFREAIVRRALALLDRSRERWQSLASNDVERAALAAAMVSACGGKHEQSLRMLAGYLGSNGVPCTTSEVEIAIGPQEFLDAYLEALEPYGLEPEISIALLRDFATHLAESLDALYRASLGQRFVAINPCAIESPCEAERVSIGDTAGAIERILALIARRHPESHSHGTVQNCAGRDLLVAHLREMQRAEMHRYHDVHKEETLLQQSMRSPDNEVALPLSHSDTAMIELVELVIQAVTARVPLEFVPDLLRLRIPYAIVALMDGQSFLDPTHPARRLLEGIARAASSQVPETRQFERVQHIVRRTVIQVLEKHGNDTSSLHEILRDFHRAMGRQTVRERAAEARAIRAAQNREQVRKARAHVAEVIAGILAGPPIVEPINNLLTKEWSEYLELIHVSDGAEAPRFREGVDVAAKVVSAARAPKRDAAGILSSISHTLQYGLLCIGHEPLEARDVWSVVVKVLVKERYELPPPSNNLKAKAAHAVCERVPTGSSSQCTGVHCELTTASVGVPLVVGSWVEMRNRNGEFEEAKLSWIGVVSRMHLFVNRHGMRLEEIGADVVAHRLTEGTIRPCRERPSIVGEAIGGLLGGLR